MGNAHHGVMTSPQPVTFELESFGTIEAMIDDASALSRTLPSPQARPEELAPASYEISDGCLTLTDGMPLYGS